MKRFCVVWALAAGAAGAQVSPTVSTVEPRAYGWQLGDVVVREVAIEADAAYTLEADSLPRPGRVGSAFELRRIDVGSAPSAAGRQHRLRLEYQVFLSPQAVRTLELPPLTLRFAHAGRSQDVRVDAWPVTVSPLVPVEVSPRSGLGELQPDEPPPPVDTRPTRWRLLALASVAALMGLVLLHLHVGLPWLARRQRPFESAWRALRRLPAADAAGRRRAAFEQLHAALNQSAGAALFEGGVDAFVAARPPFAPLREDLRQFFQRSRTEFFAAAAPGDDAWPWLQQLCRRARDAERAL
jgi:mxaA protein